MSSKSPILEVINKSISDFTEQRENIRHILESKHKYDVFKEMADHVENPESEKETMATNLLSMYEARIQDGAPGYQKFISASNGIIGMAKKLLESNKLPERDLQEMNSILKGLNFHMDHHILDSKSIKIFQDMVRSNPKLGELAAPLQSFLESIEEASKSIETASDPTFIESANAEISRIQAQLAPILSSTLLSPTPPPSRGAASPTERFRYVLRDFKQPQPPTGLVGTDGQQPEEDSGNPYSLN